MRRGRPSRDQLFMAIKRVHSRGLATCDVKGELKRQLHWWLSMLRSPKAGGSFFWAIQPRTPLVLSDTSGEDGWGVCTLGFHIVGCWPTEWRSSSTKTDPHMLFKELFPPALTTRLLAPFLSRSVLTCALDNAGAAFSLNALSCGCHKSLRLLRWIADTLDAHSLGLLAGHAHREYNAHTDALSHPLSRAMWSRVIAQAPVSKKNMVELHFAIVNKWSGKAALATVAFKRAVFRDAKDVPC